MPGIIWVISVKWPQMQFEKLGILQNPRNWDNNTKWQGTWRIKLCNRDWIIFKSKYIYISINFFLHFYLLLNFMMKFCYRFHRVLSLPFYHQLYYTGYRSLLRHWYFLLTCFFDSIYTVNVVRWCHNTREPLIRDRDTETVAGT